jgi:hypothetical protein
MLYIPVAVFHKFETELGCSLTTWPQRETVLLWMK